MMIGNKDITDMFDKIETLDEGDDKDEGLNPLGFRVKLINNISSWNKIY